RGSGEDRFEEFGAEFQHRLRAGFLALAEEEPARCMIINGNRPADEVGAEVQALVLSRLA
ncbi:MAG: thymidylate kinase, partial [Litoreibacter sp.]|nr:thymidylate kinase [Litoreibacter sp.]